MRKLFSLAIAIPMLCAILFSNAAKVQAQDVSVSFQAFYDNLAPYGQWVYDGQFGNVFVPNVEPGWRPYTRGYWAMTEMGNTWVSEEPWSWAVYHYGRWTYSGYYGWIWIPGYEWAPAWVSWRWGHGYAGWAPLGPSYQLGGIYECPETWWTFVQPHYLYEPRWIDHYEGFERNRYYVRHTSYMDNYEREGRYGHYNSGPRAEVYEKATGHRVEVYRVSNVREAGGARVEGNAIHMYRPAVQQGSMNTAKPANVIAAPHKIEAKGESYSPKAANATPAFRAEHPMPSSSHNNQPPPSHNNTQSPSGHNNPAPTPSGHNNPAPQPPHNNPAPPPPHNNPTPQPPHNNPAPPPPHNPPPSQQPPHNNPAPQPQHNNPAPQQQHNNPAPAQHNNPAPAQHSNPAPRPAPAPAPRPAPSSKKK